MEAVKELFGVSEQFPTTTHQSIIGTLFTEISVYFRAGKGHCQVLASPFAVFLKEDGEGCIQPDIVVVCDRGKLDDEGCHGAPDWVIEVVSPASRRMDYGRKLGAYIDAGVREYWIVDAEKQLIVTYYLEQPDAPIIYQFGDIVRSGIYDDLVIDTAQLENIQFSKAQSVHTGSKTVREQPEDFSQESGAFVKEPEESKAGDAERGVQMFVSVEEVKAYIESNFAGLAASKNKGQIMKAVMGALKGRADSKLVNEAVAELCK